MSVESVTNNMSEGARKLADDVLQSAEEAVRATETMADESLHRAEKRVQDLRAEASPAIQEFASRAQEMASQCIDYCAMTTDRARRHLREASDATTRYVEQQPAKSMAIAVASGAALGALALWLTRRDSRSHRGMHMR